MEWSRVMEFLVGMEQVTWSDWESKCCLTVFLGPVFCCLGEVLNDQLSIDLKKSMVLISWSMTRKSILGWQLTLQHPRNLWMETVSYTMYLVQGESTQYRGLTIWYTFNTQLLLISSRYLARLPLLGSRLLLLPSQGFFTPCADQLL